MQLQSDLSVNVTPFDPNAVTEKTKRFTDILIQNTLNEPKWWEIGAESYRQRRASGSAVIDTGKEIELPSRSAGRGIPCRYFIPKDGKPRGLAMHIHGGGWVVSSEKEWDLYLNFLANTFQLTVLSIGYRLAPENPFPAGRDDCIDAAEYLVDNAEEQLGVKLICLVGESAGAHYASLVSLHLLKARPSFQLKCMSLQYGVFDVSRSLPQHKLWNKQLMLTRDMMTHYVQAITPDWSAEERRHPDLSPFYADLRALAEASEHKKLPTTLFACGTEDPLLDDTVYFGAKWLMSGGEAVIKVYPGAAHGFSAFLDPATFDLGRAFVDDMTQFLQQRLA